MASVRRSGRERRANPKYTDDGWDKKTSRILRESSESSGSSLSDSDVEAVSKDRDFTHRLVESKSPHNWSDGENNGRPVRAGSEHASSPTPGNSGDDTSVVSDRSKGTRRWSTMLPTGNTHSSPNTHSRGLRDLDRRGGQKDYLALFGSEVEDLRPILHARNTWLRRRDITLPSRQTLQDPQSSFMAVWSERPATVTSTDLQSLHSKQKFRQYDDRAEIDSAIPEHTMKLSSSRQLQAGKLRHLEALDLNKALASPETGAGDEPAESAPPSAATADEGWILHTGKRVSDIAWAPDVDGNQFLAIARKATAKQRALFQPTSSTGAPAFLPSASWLSEIQIWRFAATRPVEEQYPTLDMSCSPILVKTFRIECGDVRQLAWSPLHSGHSIKLLATLSTDGLVHIVTEGDIFTTSASLQILSPLSSKSLHQDIANAALDLCPPPSIVFTTVAWCTPTDLAIGASDGTLRLYNILQALSASSEPPQPYLTHQLHNTYTLALSPAFPSSIPFYVASTSAASDLILTDLRSPDQDRVRHIPIASQLPSKALVYAPFTRSWLTLVNPSDLNSPQTVVTCHHLRHFYHETQVAWLPPMNGQGTALCASPHHPCILVGNAKGTVFATNYLRSVLPTAVNSRLPGTGAYLQAVCEYEFRPDDHGPALTHQDNAVEETTNANGSDALFHGPDVRPGTSTIHPASIPVPVGDANLGSTPNAAATRDQRSTRRGKGKEKEKDSDKRSKAAVSDVIFEEEQAVTSLCWNPNQRYAGWVAMGWASGIVRVRDLSHDSV